MPEYTRNKHFRIHANDAGSEAYDDKYVRWLEAEVKRLRDEIDRHLAENHSQDVIEDHDAPIYKYVWERQDDPAPQIDEDWITYGTSRWTSRWTRGG